MNKKAVKIDLSTFFHDERKMTCVLVDPNWKSVECLQKRIEYLFGVESVRFLSDGYFLPPQESIEIVKFCNDLKAFVPKHALETRKKKKSKNIERLIDAEESAEAELTNDSHKKRKCSHVSKSISNDAKRSRSSNTLLSEITSTSEQIPTPPPIFLQNVDDGLKIKKTKTKKSKVSIINSNYDVKDAIKECQLQESNTENITSLEENTLIQSNSVNEPKKRHTSTPKEKKISEIVEDREETSCISSIPSSTFLNKSKMLEQHSNANHSSKSPNLNNPFKRPKSSRAHIYFNDTGEVVSPSTNSNTKTATKEHKESKTIVIFRCPLSEITNGIQTQKPRIFNLKSKNVTKNQTQKQVVEIQEEIIISAGQTANSANGSPTKEAIVMNENAQQQTNIETAKVVEETNSLNEKNSLNNISTGTDNTTIAKKNSDDGETSARNEETNDTTQSQNESLLQLTTANETSITSVDCVDLSNDFDEDVKIEKLKTTRSKLKRSVQEKHDLTKDDDDEDNNSTTSSDVEEISEIIDLNETEDNCEDSVNNSSIHSTSLKDIKVDKILPFSTDMIDMPSIGDIIVFKIRYVNKKQQYVQTNYIAGKAEYINRRTKSIKIFVMDGFSELSYLPNQLICNLDDSQDYIKYIQIKLSDMVGPKLFSIS